jgi:hypothetical protein
MNVLALVNRACRQLEVKEFTALSVTDQQTVIDCTNKALTDIQYLLPEYLKSGPDSATLAAPLAIDLDGTAIPTQVGGRSVVFNGDNILNQFVNDVANNAGAPASLKFDRSATATDVGTLYGDVVRLSSRVKSISNVRILGDRNGLLPWGIDMVDPWGFSTSTNQVGIPAYYRIDPVHPSDRAENEDAGIYTMRGVSAFLRVYPLPQVVTRITYTVEYAPFTIDLSDTLDLTPPAVPILDQHHADLLSLIESELALTDIFAGDANKATRAGDNARERLSREPSKLDAGRIMRRGTPRGW